jgi:hypothetical protein
MESMERPERYQPEATPKYRPGDDVILSAPAMGRMQMQGRVVRIVPIAPLHNASARYLYMLDVEDRVGPVLAAEEECQRPTWT